MHERWHLSHARGYLALGMVEEAALELAFISPSRNETEVLALRAMVLQEQRLWPLLLPLAAELSRREPAEPGWWVMWAYAARRADSLTQAESILRDAETQHPDDATIQFNLGCYACLRGALEEAKRRVNRAISLDDDFREQARTDEDLQSLRDTGYQPPATQN